MKILKIDFKNINSLAGEHSIDFTQKPFVENSLFAITGPTGSGKSTILDVIPLALFNKIPRLDSAISKSVMLKQGAILTRGKKEAYARVTYVCKKGIFTSEWSVRISDRSGALQDYEMFLYDGKGKPITQKKSEVPAKNEDLIGLNYEQFIKSVMLAQGEFSKFLKVKKEERSALLEQITGTDIYRKIGIAAFERYKTFKTSVEDWQKRKVELTAKLPTQEEEQSLLNKEQQWVEQKKKKVHALDSVKNLCKQWQDYTKLKSKVNDLNSLLEQKKKAMADFDAHQGQHLILHEKTESFAEVLNQYSHLHKTQIDLDKVLKDKGLEYEVLQEDKARTKQKIADWLKQDNLVDEKIPSVLETFRKKMELLREQRKSKRIAYKTIEKDVNYLLEILDTTYKEGVESSLQKKQEEVLSLLQKEGVESMSKEDYLYQKEVLDFEETNIQNADRLATRLKHLEQSIQEKSNQKQEKQKALEGLPHEIEKLQHIFDKNEALLKVLVLKIENQHLKKSLEDYRNRLEDDQPCPLCGALHHPYAQHGPVIEDGLEIKKKALVLQVEQHKTALMQSQAYQEAIGNQIKEIETALMPLENQFKELKQTFKEKFPAMEIDDDFTSKIEGIKTRRKTLEDIYKAVLEKNALEKALPLINQLNVIKIEGAEISNQLNLSIGDLDPTEQTQHLLRLWYKVQQQLVESEKRLLEIKKQTHENHLILTQLQNELLPKVVANGFLDIRTALEHRLSADRVKLLREKRLQLSSEINELKGTLEAYQDNLIGLQKALADTDLEGLKKEQWVLEEDINSLDNQLKEVFAQKAHHQNIITEIKALKEKIATENEQSRVWRMLDSLIGDAKGKKFNDFAQDLTLSHLLHLANRRLEQLKSRYLLSQPLQDEDDGLVAIDKDMGNQRRSVRTLSGGESFILSLALALALSDLASKNVRIETLFIDEGFGTLDPETLDKTLDTLERLQQESKKTIGVISHVEALKERISAQIQLEQNGYGFSNFKLVG